MAAADSRRIIKNAPFRVTFPILNVTTGNPITAAAGMAPKIGKDGGTLTATTNSPTEIATTSGWYFLDLTATEMSADELLFTCSSTSTNAVTYGRVLETEPCLHSGVVVSATSLSVTLPATASAVDPDYVGSPIEIVRGTGAGQFRTILAYTGSSKTAIIDRAWGTTPDSSSVYVIRNVQASQMGSDGVVAANAKQLSGSGTAADNLKALYVGGLTAGTISDTGATTTVFKLDSTFSASDDAYKNALIVFTSGPLKPTAARILAYTGSTRQVTLSSQSTLISAPANGTSVVVLAHQE